MTGLFFGGLAACVLGTIIGIFIGVLFISYKNGQWGRGSDPSWFDTESWDRLEASSRAAAEGARAE